MTSSSSDCRWFIAFVRTCCERKAAEYFDKLGYEYYLPVQREVHTWSDRRKVVERMVIPHMIFVHTTESGRLRSLNENPYLTRYMSRGKGPFDPAVVRDSEMDIFRAMVEFGGNPVKLSSEQPAAGDRVRIISGPLEGRECELVSVEGRKCLASRLGMLGTAVVEISLDAVRKISQ